MPDSFDLDDPAGSSPPPPTESRVPARPGVQTPSAPIPSRAGSQRLGPQADDPDTGAVPTRSAGVPTRQSASAAPPAGAAKASDLLRGHANYKAQESADGRPNVPFIVAERPVTKFDDVATTIFWLSLIVTVGCLAYFLFGIFSGQLTLDLYNKLDASNQNRVLTNINNAANIMEYGLLVCVASMSFLFYDEGTAGYSMLIFAVFLQILLPLIGGEFYELSRSTPSFGTHHLYLKAQALWWIPGVPGVILTLLDIIRRFNASLEESKVKKSTMKYGQAVIKTEKTRNLFLGDCWNMPYCREYVRAKCPIFLKKRGPCWRTKRGCMCDPTIVINAKAGDWKSQVAGAVGAIEGTSNAARPKPSPMASSEQGLSKAFKTERCRQCVIYNTHQEQKYKALVAVVLVGTILLFYFFNGVFLQGVAIAYHGLDKVLGKISFTSAQAPTTAVPAANAPAVPTPTPLTDVDLAGPIGWIMLGLVGIFGLAKVLQLVEYCCFKIKI